MSCIELLHWCGLDAQWYGYSYNVIFTRLIYQLRLVYHWEWQTTYLHIVNKEIV